jgi:hypothetical protein
MKPTHIPFVLIQYFFEEIRDTAPISLNEGRVPFISKVSKNGEIRGMSLISLISPWALRITYLFGVPHLEVHSLKFWLHLLLHHGDLQLL